ncbi:hypothetical protein LTS15_000555 [Exophiala xenobiotica]|nr:hypothetical protein LTS15_000555 [Exophiala xenobiotica]
MADWAELGASIDFCTVKTYANQVRQYDKAVYQIVLGLTEEKEECLKIAVLDDTSTFDKRGKHTRRAHEISPQRSTDLDGKSTEVQTGERENNKSRSFTASSPFREKKCAPRRRRKANSNYRKQPRKNRLQ